MMEESPLNGWDDRTRRLLGDDGCRALAEARVLVVGVGGVGGYAAEMLARSGVGHLTLVDADRVDVSNLNRQIIATTATLGREKTQVMAERARSINPQVQVEALTIAVTPENIGELLDGGYDYVADCIDTVAPKVALLAECLRRKQAVVSSMGAGGRVDPTKVKVGDLWQTENDGLARAVRQRLRRAGLKRKLTVVSSSEVPASRSLVEVDSQYKRTSYGTVAPLPSMFGIFMAAHIINKLTDL